MANKTIFLVKFDVGYYAKKQPHHEWSFTNNNLLAHRYSTYKGAEERGNWGVQLGKQWNGRNIKNITYPSNYKIEEYVFEEILILKNDW